VNVKSSFKCERMSVLQNSLCDTSGSFSRSHASPAPVSYSCVSAGWRAVPRSENSQRLCTPKARDACIHREQQSHLGAPSSTAFGFHSLCAIAAEVCRHHFAQVKVLLTRSLPVEGLCCRLALLSSAADRRVLDVCALAIATAHAHEQNHQPHCLAGHGRRNLSTASPNFRNLMPIPSSAGEAMASRRQHSRPSAGGESESAREDLGKILPSTSTNSLSPHLHIYSKARHRASVAQKSVEMMRRSNVIENGWWHTEDLKIYQVVMQKSFWVAIWQHLAFPAVWLLNRKSLQAKLLMLDAHPSTRKMANDAKFKALGFLCAHLVFISTFIVWRYAKQHVHEDGDLWKALEASGALVQNISMVMPLVVYVLFYSGITLICTAHHGILLRRRTAMPPTLLLSDELERTRCDADVYIDDKLLKSLKGFRGYEQWEEGLENFYVAEMLAAAEEGEGEGGEGGAELFHHVWRQRMIGTVDKVSSQRIQRWLGVIHSKARAGNTWRLAWYALMAFNVVHGVWPIALISLEVSRGTAGGLALLLTVPMAVASAYLLHTLLRLSLLAVMHFSRVRTMWSELTRLVAKTLPLPAEASREVHIGVATIENVARRELEWQSAAYLRGGDVFDEASVRDWWRLRVLLISASSAFSSLYWLHFSCLLVGNVALTAFLVPYFTFHYEHKIQMRYTIPLLLNSISMYLNPKP